MAFAIALLSTMLSPLFAGPARADDDSRARAGVPRGAQIARVVSASKPKARISKRAYIAGARRAGVRLTTQDRAAIARAVSCWRWNAWKKYENVWGADLVKSNHRVNWCGDGKWIRRHAYTERWGTTHWPGWNYEGVTSKSNKYGVGWNVYYSTTQNKFCYINFYGCVQQKNPYHSTWAGGGGGAGWR